MLSLYAGRSLTYRVLKSSKIIQQQVNGHMFPLSLKAGVLLSDSHKRFLLGALSQADLVDPLAWFLMIKNSSQL